MVHAHRDPGMLSWVSGIQIAARYVVGVINGGISVACELHRIT